MRSPLYLALLLVGCSTLRAANVAPSNLDNAIYRVGEDEAVIVQVEGTGTASCGPSCSASDTALVDRYYWAPGESDRHIGGIF